MKVFLAMEKSQKVVRYTRSYFYTKILVFNPFVPNAPFLYPLKTRFSRFYGFLMFSADRERVHWERMG